MISFSETSIQLTNDGEALRSGGKYSLEGPPGKPFGDVLSDLEATAAATSAAVSGGAKTVEAGTDLLQWGGKNLPPPLPPDLESPAPTVADFTSNTQIPLLPNGLRAEPVANQIASLGATSAADAAPATVALFGLSAVGNGSALAVPGHTALLASQAVPADDILADVGELMVPALPDEAQMLTLAEQMNGALAAHIPALAASESPPAPAGAMPASMADRNIIAYLSGQAAGREGAGPADDMAVLSAIGADLPGGEDSDQPSRAPQLSAVLTAPVGLDRAPIAQALAAMGADPGASALDFSGADLKAAFAADAGELGRGAPEANNVKPLIAQAAAAAPVGTLLPGADIDRSPAAKFAELTTLASPLGDPKWGAEVAGRVNVMLKNGLSEANLQLTPPELGRLEIKISTEGNQAKVLFLVHDAAARQALEQAMPRLRDMLDQSGLQLVHAQVADHGSSQGREREVAQAMTELTPAEIELPADEIHYQAALPSSDSFVDFYV